MRSKAAGALLFTMLMSGADTPYRAALPGYRYEFPRDHFSHPEFKTEWWYYTGNLRNPEGRRFGFELTFFRQAVDREKPASVWDLQDVWLAHFAVSDLDGRRFFHTQRLNRSGAGLAGADSGRARVWNGNWFVETKIGTGAPGGIASQKLEAVAERFRIGLELRPLKPPVIHGVDGVSQKAAGAGRASHYISFTRLQASGSIAIEGREFTVEGLAWMDHEFFTHQLEPNQTGWDWFSLQFENGTELMLFRLRHKDGSPDPFSAGTFVDAQGHVRPLKASEFELLPGRTWTSPETRGVYPIEWTIRVPALGIGVALKTQLPNQELTTQTRNTTAYWEGAIEISGTQAGRALNGTGYLEMTGYAAPVRMGE